MKKKNSKPKKHIDVILVAVTQNFVEDITAKANWWTLRWKN